MGQIRCIMGNLQVAYRTSHLVDIRLSCVTFRRQKTCTKTRDARREFFLLLFL